MAEHIPYDFGRAEQVSRDLAARVVGWDEMIPLHLSQKYPSAADALIQLIDLRVAKMLMREVEEARPDKVE